MILERVGSKQRRRKGAACVMFISRDINTSRGKTSRRWRQLQHASRRLVSVCVGRGINSRYCPRKYSRFAADRSRWIETPLSFLDSTSSGMRVSLRGETIFYILILRTVGICEGRAGIWNKAVGFWGRKKIIYFHYSMAGNLSLFYCARQIEGYKLFVENFLNGVFFCNDLNFNFWFYDMLN